jgi:hypothetical protein
MHRTNSYFEDRQLEKLASMARAEGISRSDVLRRLVDQAIAGDGARLEADLAAIRESFGGAPGLAVPARERDLRTDAQDALWRR